MAIVPAAAGALVGPPLAPILQAGQHLLVCYDGFDLFHERILLAAAECSPDNNNLWLIFTPDLDMYIEDYGIQNQDVIAIRMDPLRG